MVKMSQKRSWFYCFLSSLPRQVVSIWQTFNSGCGGACWMILASAVRTTPLIRVLLYRRATQSQDHPLGYKTVCHHCLPVSPLRHRRDHPSNPLSMLCCLNQITQQGIWSRPHNALWLMCRHILLPFLPPRWSYCVTSS